MVLLTVRDDRRNELLALLEATRVASTREPGTLQWQLHDDSDDPTTLALYESFLNENAVEEHDRSAAAIALVAAFDDCLAAPPIVHLLHTRQTGT
ncbi:putative quinol monooxygenase [Subtercola lobariae]